MVGLRQLGLALAALAVFLQVCPATAQSNETVFIRAKIHREYNPSEDSGLGEAFRTIVQGVLADNGFPNPNSSVEHAATQQAQSGTSIILQVSYSAENSSFGYWFEHLMHKQWTTLTYESQNYALYDYVFSDTLDDARNSKTRATHGKIIIMKIDLDSITNRTVENTHAFRMEMAQEAISQFTSLDLVRTHYAPFLEYSFGYGNFYAYGPYSFIFEFNRTIDASIVRALASSVVLSYPEIGKHLFGLTTYYAYQIHETFSLFDSLKEVAYNGNGFWVADMCSIFHELKDEGRLSAIPECKIGTFYLRLGVNQTYDQSGNTLLGEAVAETIKQMMIYNTPSDYEHVENRDGGGGESTWVILKVTLLSGDWIISFERSMASYLLYNPPSVIVDGVVYEISEYDSYETLEDARNNNRPRAPPMRVDASMNATHVDHMDLYSSSSPMWIQWRDAADAEFGPLGLDYITLEYPMTYTKNGLEFIRVQFSLMFNRTADDSLIRSVAEVIAIAHLEGGGQMFGSSGYSFADTPPLIFRSIRDSYTEAEVDIDWCQLLSDLQGAGRISDVSSCTRFIVYLSYDEHEFDPGYGSWTKYDDQISNLLNGLKHNYMNPSSLAIHLVENTIGSNRAILELKFYSPEMIFSIERMMVISFRGSDPWGWMGMNLTYNPTLHDTLDDAKQNRPRVPDEKYLYIAIGIDTPFQHMYTYMDNHLSETTDLLNAMEAAAKSQFGGSLGLIRQHPLQLSEITVGGHGYTRFDFVLEFNPAWNDTTVLELAKAFMRAHVQGTGGEYGNSGYSLIGPIFFYPSVEDLLAQFAYNVDWCDVVASVLQENGGTVEFCSPGFVCVNSPDGGPACDNETATTEYPNWQNTTSSNGTWMNNDTTTEFPWSTTPPTT